MNEKKNNSNMELNVKSSLAKSNLFDRVVNILEQSRSNIVRSVNHNMVLGYWMIGREIVEEVQSGDERAEYGKNIIEELSVSLTKRYGKGFSAPTLWNFRQFYQVYSDYVTILSPLGRELESLEANQSLSGSEMKTLFSSRLSWSHYRALMRVKNDKAREFYEKEAVECGWDKRDLERQIHSQYFERMLNSQNPQKMLEAGRQETTVITSAIDTLKNPYVLEFLNIPELPVLHESQLESAIISQLQAFLLELGKGFAFVGRQKRLQFEGKDYYVDLVFYNCVLKCYLLIDLKIGEISHSDVGQMDGYVRMFDGLYTTEGDNPTIGLILCAEKNEAVAKYSVLNDRKQIFASKYMLYLPTEEELATEIMREQRLIENADDVVHVNG